MSQTPVHHTSFWVTATSMPIPQHWSPEQALAVWECLTDLAQCIWNRYEVSLLELIQPEIEPPDTEHLQLLEPDDDDIPF